MLGETTAAKMEERLCGVVGAVLGLIVTCCAFNLDTSVPVVKQHSPATYFGFSVAQHIVSDGAPGADIQYKIIVGAPRANNTVSTIDALRQTFQPGGIYSCPMSPSRGGCEELDIITSYNSRKEDYKNSWLGVAVSSQAKPEGKLMTCAHRFKQTPTSSSIWAKGICFKTNNMMDYEDVLEPCGSKNPQHGHGDWGVCQSGASLAVSTDSVLIGSPGVYNWRGMMTKNILEMSLFEQPTMYNSHAKDLGNTQPLKPVTNYYSYLGMSSAIGDIFKADEKPAYIGGAPRSSGTGQVILFKHGVKVSSGEGDLTVTDDRILTGDQFGSGFGYAVATVDLNGDTYDDLVIGAPFFHGDGLGGQIYVYMNDQEGIFNHTEPVIIQSRKMNVAECKQLNCENARFGFSIANAGDLDGDGFSDIVVGAPFEGAGAVYVFRGSIDGIIPKYSQHIKASDLVTAGANLKTFGYSLSGGVDMDRNTYPDVLVGAYESSTAIVFRTRPVINMQVEMASTFKPETVTEIDPSVKICHIDNRPHNCFYLRLCFLYAVAPKNGVQWDRIIEYRLEGDILNNSPRKRIFFKGSRGEDDYIIKRQITLNDQSALRCKEEPHVVYIQSDSGNSDFLTPIKFNVTFWLKKLAPPTMNPSDASLPDINTYPILNPNNDEKYHLVNFKKECGVDKICQSDLDLEAGFRLETDEQEHFILKLGINTQPQLTIKVSNAGEDAHQTTVWIKPPTQLGYIETKSVDGGETPFSCHKSQDEWACEIGNPLKNGQKAEFVIFWDTDRLTTGMNDLEFTIHINTTSQELDKDNDRVKFIVKVVVETDMLVRASSDPTNVYYGGIIRGESDIKYEDEIGVVVTHKYEIKNDGPGRVSNSTAMIYWPYEVANNYPKGKHLLYLLEPPKIDEGSACYPEEWAVNAVGVKIDAPGRCYPQPHMINPNDITVDAYKSLTNRPVKRPAGVARRNDSVVADERSARVRREYTVKPARQRNKDTGKIMNIVTLDCDLKTAKCHVFRCIIGDLLPKSSVAIELRAALWNSTFLEDYRNVDEVHIYSKAEIHIEERLHVKQTNYINDVDKAHTIALPDLDVVAPKGVPLWVIIVAVLAGLILLILLIILLWKCGFFRRKRAEDMREHKAKLEKEKHTKKISKKKQHNYYD